MIRFYNGKVLRFLPDAVITEEEVWTDGKLISYVGPTPQELPSFEREINLEGNLLIPGFKNAHTHTPMVFARSASDGKPLNRWLNEDIFPKEAKLTYDSVYAFTKGGILEYLSGGITTAFDMYMYPDAIAKACVDCGFRMVMCGAMNNFDSSPENLEEAYLSLKDKYELFSYRLGVHAEYTTSRERLEYAASLAEKYKEPLYTHLSETKGEVADCIERYGMTPPQFLDQLGFFQYGGGGFHCVHFTEEDRKLFRDKGLYAVHCPASNLKLDSGIAVVPACGRHIPMNWALGTDGAGSNNALDMFREMYLAAVLSIITYHDPAAFPAGDILKMACCTGADAMGLPQCDNIAEGKYADLALIDLNLPNMQPENNLVNNLVLAGKSENVYLTMVNGKVLYERGQFYIRETPEEIYRSMRSFMKELN